MTYVVARLEDDFTLREVVPLEMRDEAFVLSAGERGEQPILRRRMKRRWCGHEESPFRSTTTGGRKKKAGQRRVTERRR